MKRYLLLTCLMIGYSALYSQEKAKEDNRDYNFKNWRVLFQMNGPTWSGSVNFVKPSSEQWAFRIGFSPDIRFTKNSSDNFNDLDDDLFESRSTSKRFGGAVSLGAEYHLLKKKKLDPYVLMGLALGLTLERSDRLSSWTYEEPFANNIISREREEKIKGAPRFGITPFAGFGVNYYFHEKLAFGVEYGLRTFTSILKGTTSSEESVKETFTDGSVDVIESDTDLKQTSFNFGITQTIGFHIIYIMSAKK